MSDRGGGDADPADGTAFEWVATPAPGPFFREVNLIVAHFVSVSISYAHYIGPVVAVSATELDSTLVRIVASVSRWLTPAASPQDGPEPQPSVVRGPGLGRLVEQVCTDAVLDGGDHGFALARVEVGEQRIPEHAEPS